MKTSCISGCLRDIAWRNNNLNVESKTRIYNSSTSDSNIHSEGKTNASKTIQIMKTVEVKAVRKDRI